MGEMVAVMSGLLIFCTEKGSWRKKLAKTFLFLGCFWITLIPWYWRNYRLTHDWFFCPLSGIYLNVFSAPKILRRTLGIPLKKAWEMTQLLAQKEIMACSAGIKKAGLCISPLINRRVALPIICASPFYFIVDWITEVIKTTFDLYSSQLVSFANNTFWFDPLEEFLTEKISACLWYQAMPWWMRFICWAECIYACLLWIGIVGGVWFYVTHLTNKKKRLQISPSSLPIIWLLCLIMIISVTGISGGFGYARLRLPIEPLLIILSLTFWYNQWLIYRKRTR